MQSRSMFVKWQNIFRTDFAAISALVTEQNKMNPMNMFVIIQKIFQLKPHHMD